MYIYIIIIIIYIYILFSSYLVKRTSCTGDLLPSCGDTRMCINYVQNNDRIESTRGKLDVTGADTPLFFLSGSWGTNIRGDDNTIQW